MPRVPSEKSLEDAPYAVFADQLQRWLLAYRMRNPRQPYMQKKVAEEMGINPTTFSKMARGREKPSPEHCRIIARFFDVPLEEVLRAANYPDLSEVIRQVESDSTPQDTETKQKVLVVLKNILTSPAPKAKEWRQLPKDSPVRERTEEILASDLDAYTKAVKYFNAVWEWYHLGDAANLSLKERQTDDMLHAIS